MSESSSSLDLALWAKKSNLRAVNKPGVAVSPLLSGTPFLRPFLRRQNSFQIHVANHSSNYMLTPLIQKYI